MFGIGTGELILILVIAMLVVGPERMVEYSRRGGRLLAKIRAQTSEVSKEFREALDASPDGDPDNPLTTIAQVKSEAEGAVHDLQEAFSMKGPTSSPAKPATTPKPPQQAPTPPPAETEPAPAAAPSEPAVAQPSNVTEPDAVELGAVELGGVELVADDEVTELAGPTLVDEGDAAAEGEGQS